MGKTSVAKRLYVLLSAPMRRSPFFNDILWLNVNGDLSGQMFKECRKYISIPESAAIGEMLKGNFKRDAIERIISNLNNRSGRNLLFLDNLAFDHEHIIEYREQLEVVNCLVHSCNWKIIATSYQKISGFDIKPIPSLSGLFPVKCFLRFYKVEQRESIKLNDILSIEFGGYPLYIELLAKQSNELHLSIDEIIKRFEKYKLSVTEAKVTVEEVDHAENRSINNALGYMRYLFNQVSLAKEEAKILRQFCSLLPSGMSAKFIDAVWMNNRKKPLERDRFWLSIKKLESEGWLSCDYRGYYVHEMIQIIVNQDGVRIKKPYTVIAEGLSQLVTDNKMRPFQSFELATIVTKFLNTTSSYAVFYQLLREFGVLLFNQNRFNSACSIFYDYIAACRKKFGPDNLRTIDGMLFLARCLQKLGENQAAYKTLIEALRALRGNRYDNVTVLELYRELALLMRTTGKYNIALQLELRIKDIINSSPRILNDDALLKLTVSRLYFELGIINRYMGDHQLAIKNKLYALKIRKYSPYSTALEIADSYDSLGVSMREIGKHRFQLLFTSESLRIRKLNLGNWNLDVAKSYSGIGIAHLNLGMFESARFNLYKSLIIRKSILPKGHLIIGRNLYFIAKLFCKADRFEESIKFLKLAQATSLADLPEEHVWRKEFVELALFLG